MPHTFMYIYIHIHRYTQIYMSVPLSLIMISVYSKLFHQFALTNTKHGPRMLGILHRYAIRNGEFHPWHQLDFENIIMDQVYSLQLTGSKS